jgi:ABC-type phosphate/phosphonate transport system substrate-binding protein
MRKTAISMGTPTDAMVETVARPASLGMYDFPWLRRTNDTFWAAVARELRSRGVQAVPQHLDRARPLDAIWRDANLLLAQTCGYPLITSLSGGVSLVATPVYDLPGCFGATHRSLVVVRAGVAFGDVGALRGTRAAINGWDSNSGMNAFRATLALAGARCPFFSSILVTGGHLASLAAVGAGLADVAAIDCVTAELAKRHRPELLTGIRVLTETPLSPALPLITRAHATAKEIATLRDALRAVAREPTLARVRHTLGLGDFEVLPVRAYDRVLELERQATALGYPRIE